jgi:uncharacterized membrane protein
MAVKTIVSISSLFLIGAYLAPLGCLPLFSPRYFLPALLILLSGLLSTWHGQHNALSQYPAAAIPFLFIAFIEVLPKFGQNQEIQSIIKRTKNHAVTYSIILLVIISWLIVSNGRIQLASIPDKHDAAINQVISLVPDNVTVTASNEIFPHLCTRTVTYLDSIEGEPIAAYGSITNAVWGYPEKDTEYVVIDTRNDRSFAVYQAAHANEYKLINTVDGVRLYRLNK